MENHIYMALLGKKIRDLRKDMGFTQEEFAQKIGVTRLVVLKIEAGNPNTPITRIRDIAEVLRVDIGDLMTI